MKHYNIGRVNFKNIHVFLKLSIWSVKNKRKVQMMFTTAMFDDTKSFLDTYQLWRKWGFGAAITMSEEETKTYLELMKKSPHFELWFKDFDEMVQHIVLEEL